MSGHPDGTIMIAAVICCSILPFLATMKPRLNYVELAIFVAAQTRGPIRSVGLHRKNEAPDGVIAERPAGQLRRLRGPLHLMLCKASGISRNHRRIPGHGRIELGKDELQRYPKTHRSPGPLAPVTVVGDAQDRWR